MYAKWTFPFPCRSLAECMGNICWSESRPPAVKEIPLTGTTSSYAGTSSKFTGFSQDRSSVEQSFNDSVQSDSVSSSHRLNDNVESLKVFSYNDLKAATRSFRSQSVIGEGGFGVVFKGYVDENTLVPSRPGKGMPVAIKKLKLEGMQGHKEWLAEIHYLGALHHQNLVKLIGFCAEDRNRLLVYEYMIRGSLENHLFQNGRQGPAMPWETRMKIALDAAEGLAFLHGAQKPVIYRDLKASNILLDSQYNAKLSDFGLAKYGPLGDDTHVSTRIMGTYGYAAPEYLATGHLSLKSDIYSFGVVLLELITGLRAADKKRPPGQEKLVDWVKPFLKDKKKVMQIVDARVQTYVSIKEAYKLAQLVNGCLDEFPKSRPTAKHILETLANLHEPVEAV
ncbi:hypothetical protein KP509_23G005000 [Ceratopteris richardii]|uniref:non-specific serine/threonine protein kinase n=1 Tax=Ceratopteris richardii TaxID=49495 RepID=A0A8T2RZE9_CERRI|nr:hypothetical protein KP509_23G005000 [Ceratopteris richardii]